MYRLVKFELIIKYIAIATFSISILLYFLVQKLLLPDYSLFQVITVSSIISTALIFLLLSQFFFQQIWAIARLVNNSLFPDLNGAWEGEIILESEEKIIVRAVIRQSLLSFQIDMHGETMKSITLETTPVVEQGQNKLYYIYRSTPKDPTRHPYNGSTLFDVRVVKEENDNKKTVELSGHYYTNRKTVGRVRLRQVCNDSNRDVSFY